jgi:hypothetical protein
MKAAGQAGHRRSIRSRPGRGPSPGPTRGSVARVLEKPALILIDVQREYFTQESPLWIPDGERPHAIVHETTLAAQADGFSTLMDVATAQAELAQHVA